MFSPKQRAYNRLEKSVVRVETGDMLMRSSGNLKVGTVISIDELDLRGGKKRKGEQSLNRKRGIVLSRNKGGTS